MAAVDDYFESLDEPTRNFPFSAQVVDAVRHRLPGFELSKGTIRFSVERPLPDDVVSEVVRLRAAEIAGKAG
jgi:uncharacterized protein YdhG (YjbR/CyaY superfamily)